MVFKCVTPSVLVCTFIIWQLPSLWAQEIDNFSVIHDFTAEEHIRLHIENDFFSQSDDDYTHGMNLEWVSPMLKKNPINYLFFKGNSGVHKYAIGIEQAWYTPEEITQSEIMIEDHPYVGLLYIKSNLASDYITIKARVKSSFLLGVMGPVALGEPLQRFAHQVTNNVLPQGWQNQIKNDVVLNYSVGIEKLFFAYQNNVQVYGTATGRLGTLYTDVSFGGILSVGFLTNPFSGIANTNKLSVYGYLRPQVSFVGYNATLQGGVFNPENIYILDDSTVERSVGRVDFGFVLKTRTYYAEFYKVLQAREYTTGRASGWGGIKLGVKL